MQFEIGQPVQLKADHKRKGIVIAILDELAGNARYRVYHSGNELRDYLEDQLIADLALTTGSALVKSLTSGDWLPTDIFRARLTSARLSNPQLDSVYALHSARIQFIPFQFKPLLRFLRADAPRLLIADEVGVGKTIEAGLILHELSVRQTLKNILIVCPKALTTKWQSEMLRFDQKFRKLDSESLKYCLNETDYDGEWPAEYCHSIVHLELLRMDDYINGRKNFPGFRNLSPPPRFDLLIVDEAHHVRNTDTLSREAVRLLAENSEAVVFLSATPVHVGSENLFSLLNLLRPETFLDFSVFQEMVEPNQFIIEGMRALRSRKGLTLEQARTAIENAASTNWGTRVLVKDPSFCRVRAELASGNELADKQRIRLLRDLEEAHTLSHIMNRTRRRDIGAFTIREPKTICVEFTKPQKEFYDLLINFRREFLRLNYSSVVVSLITDTLQRQAASCLPALVPAIDSFLSTGRFCVNDLTDDEDDWFDETALAMTLNKLPEDLQSMAAKLREHAKKLPPDDPKLQNLLDEIIAPSVEKEPGKVLIFSYFLHTLNYLKSHIEERGFRCGVISGKLEEQDRQELRDRFRRTKDDANAIDVLLSSEVGCEGLDYEFCDRMVNYDIPWNPMRLEQRIGRIDRFGQKADKVLIFNFRTPGTVEDRIYFRCYDRLGIFTQTIGDLEEVLGETFREINRTALNPHLTTEQQELKLSQLLDNALRKAEEHRRLEEEGASILGLDQSLLQEVDDLETEGRFVASNELQHLVEVFMSISEIEGKLIPDSKISQLYKLRISKEGKRYLLLDLETKELRGPLVQEFRRWLEGPEPTLQVTFDQNYALQNRRIAFITPLHPLVKSAVAHFTQDTNTLIVSSLMAHIEDVSPGKYLFACDLWEYFAIKDQFQMIGAAWSIESKQIEQNLSSRLVKSLGSVYQPHDKTILESAAVNEGIKALDEFLEQCRSSELTLLCESNSTTANRRLASLDVSFRKRIERLETEIASTSDEKIVKMKESALARLHRDLELKRSQILLKSQPDIITRRVAAGIIEVLARKD